MRSRSSALVATLAAAALVATGCGSKGSGGGGGGDSDTVVFGAAMSLTGSLAREGQLTKEGYQLCQQKVNAKGGVPVGSKKLKLNIKYQDDTSQPDTAAQLVDQFNDQGVSSSSAPTGRPTSRRRHPSSSATAR